MLARPPPLASLMVHQTMVRGPPGREAVADDPGIHPLNGNKLDEGQGRIARPTKVKAPTVASPASLADPRGIQNQRAKPQGDAGKGPKPSKPRSGNTQSKRKAQLQHVLRDALLTRPKGRIQVSLSRSRKRRTARPLGPPVVVVVLLLMTPQGPLLTSKSGTCPWRRRHLYMPNPLKV